MVFKFKVWESDLFSEHFLTHQKRGVIMGRTISSSHHTTIFKMIWNNAKKMGVEWAKAFLRYLHCLWLFTFSDLKTMVWPSAAFATLNFIAMSKASDADDKSFLLAIRYIFFRLPYIIGWAWINLLSFSIDNQRQPGAVDEDMINKPWRPLPSRKISSSHARRLTILTKSVALAMSCLIGGTFECVLLIALGYLYNDKNGADKNWVTRNFLNALGFVCFASGALDVAVSGSNDLDAARWLCIIGAVIFSTVHIQDMYDQVGDRARGRNTVPLALGDSFGRWSVAVSVVLWSYFCPLYWKSNVLGLTTPVILGALIALRILTMKSVKEDQKTFRLYNIWLVSLYSLPLVNAYSEN